MKSKSDDIAIKERIRKRRHDIEWEREQDKKYQRSVFVNTSYAYNSYILRKLTGSIVNTERKKPREIAVRVPIDFSVITNPEETLKCLFDFANDTRRYRAARMLFKHGGMKRYDLSAELILDIIALESIRELRSRGMTVDIGGEYPKDESLIRFLKGSGIIKHLDIKHEFLSSFELAEIERFEAQNSASIEKSTSGASTERERTVVDFVDYINNCLSKIKKELTKSGISQLTQYTGEILDNIEQHSDDNTWRIMAYLDTRSNDYNCEITILNLGVPISETIEKLPLDHYTRKQIQPVCDIHFKNRIVSNHERSRLFTLLALQGDVSCKNTGEHSTRGQGTVKLINFFQQMNKECCDDRINAQMTIFSGDTHIYFDGKYVMKKNSDGNWRLAFNETNDFNSPYDSKYIRSMPYFFPGTVIGIRFPLKSIKPKENSHAENQN